MIQVQSIRDYNKFKFKNQRGISEKHVDDIANSPTFPNSFQYHPIIVNEKYEIIDGQHRLLAAKKLKIPVYYLVQPGAGIEEIKDCNVLQKNWSYEDYINFYAAQHNKTYEILKYMIEYYRLHPSIAVAIAKQICGYQYVKNFPRAFKKGIFVINDEQKIYQFCDVYRELLDKLCREKGCESIKFIKTKYYTHALVNLYFDDNHSFNIITRKLDSHISRLEAAASVDFATKKLMSLKAARCLNV